VQRLPREDRRRLRIVETATPTGGDETAEWRGPDDVFLSVGGRLCRLFGQDGYRALLERALTIASEEYPLLRTVRPAIAPAGRLVGLPSIDAAGQRTQVFEAVGATLTALLALLVQLLGSDLVQQVLCGEDSSSVSEGGIQ
jgi:hypothetical protein